MTGRQALAKMYGGGAMVGHAKLGCAIKVVDGRVVDQDYMPVSVDLGAWFVGGLDSHGWFEVEKPKVVAHGLKELFEKDDGTMKKWRGGDGELYFVSGLAGRLKTVSMMKELVVTQDFLNMKFTLEDKQ